MSVTAGAESPPPSGRPPESNLAPRDVAGLADELVAYHALFAPLFRREEQRQWALRYLQGQLLDLERKSVEPMALALEGGNVQAMQQFISVGAWDDELILQQHQRLVAETLGDPATGVLILDGCDFPKQGGHSVGVARLWCGALGKVANCQASVVAAYASQHGYTLVDRRLYLPERWWSEAYQERWQACGIPDQTPFRTEPELAGELIETLHQRGVLPFQWVTFDEHFGYDPALLDRVAALGLCYLAEVPHDTRVWQQRPRTAVPTAKATGRPPTRARVVPGQPEPVRVDRLAEQIAADQWMPAQIKAGAKGPIVAEFAFRRAVALRDDLPGPDVWVVFRRSVDDPPELKTYLSNAPAATPLERLVWVSGMRWPVESAILESKRELGMDHYEVRSWVGWHHHLTLSLLAHHFLVRLRCRLGGKITRPDRAPSPPAVGGRAAQAALGRRDSHRAHRLDPTPQLRRLLLAPPPHPASARHVLTN
jgi:SRSO17 transposase